MADYYPLIARAISGLDASATGEQRRALYDRARSALIAQLRGVQPPLSESDITRERLTLEEAIRKVEQEAAARSRAAARGETRSGGRGDMMRSTQPSINPDAPAQAERDRRTERTERSQVARDTARPPESRPRTGQDARPAPRDPRENRDGEREPSRPGLAQRRDRADRDRGGNDRPRPPQGQGPGNGNGVRGFRDVMADADDLGSAAAQANRSARRTYANVPSPSPEFDRLEPSMEDRSGESDFAAQGQPRAQDPRAQDQAYSFDESPAEAERYQSRPPQPSRPEPPRERERKRPVLKSGIFPVKRAAAVGVVLILIGAAVAYWPQLRGLYTDMTGRSKQVEVPKKDAPADRPKITDRVGQPGTTIAPVAQRVVLYDEDPAEPQGKQYVGQVVWRTENVAGPNGTTDIAVRADIDIPDRKFKAALTIRRNNDTSLPASHTVEMTFQLPPDFAGGGVSNVPGVLMKSNEQTRGTPLAGLAVKVTDNFFLIGLSNVDADRGRNLQLLKERSWFDIPLVYANQRRAIVALEKGAPGERAFGDAFGVWGQ
jgi:hypothetical protein